MRDVGRRGRERLTKPAEVLEVALDAALEAAEPAELVAEPTAEVALPAAELAALEAELATLEALLEASLATLEAALEAEAAALEAELLASEAALEAEPEAPPTPKMVVAAEVVIVELSLVMVVANVEVVMALEACKFKVNTAVDQAEIFRVQLTPLALSVLLTVAVAAAVVSVTIVVGIATPAAVESRRRVSVFDTRCGLRAWDCLVYLHEQ